MQKKRIVFEELDKNHADLILKLRSKGLTQKIFFQTVVRSFIDDDPALVSFFEEVVKSKTRFGKKTLARIEKSAKQMRKRKISLIFLRQRRLSCEKMLEGLRKEEQGM